MRGVLTLRSCRALPALNTTTASSLIRPTITAHSRLRSLTQSHEQPRRQFHWPSALATVTDGTRDLVLGLHNVTGTPWYITIPLFAVGVNVLFRLPALIHQRRIMEKRVSTTSVKRAWFANHNDEVVMENIRNIRGKSSQDFELYMKEVAKRQKKTEKRIHGLIGAQDWKLLSVLLGLPFWLLGIDALRRIVGAPGFISMALRQTQDRQTQDWDPVDGVRLRSPSATTFEDASPMNPSYMETTNQAVSQASSYATSQVSPVLDPTLATEGMFWFTDLTVADPYSVLPCVLSLLLAHNVVPKGDRPFADRLRDVLIFKKSPNPWRLRFQRGLLTMSLAIGPITMTLPAALHLYWISSSITTLIMNRVVDRMIPLETTKMPEIRPSQDTNKDWINAYPISSATTPAPSRTSNARQGTTTPNRR